MDLDKYIKEVDKKEIPLVLAVLLEEQQHSIILEEKGINNQLLGRMCKLRLIRVCTHNKGGMQFDAYITTIAHANMVDLDMDDLPDDMPDVLKKHILTSIRDKAQKPEPDTASCMFFYKIQDAVQYFSAQFDMIAARMEAEAAKIHEEGKRMKAAAKEGEEK